MQQGMDISLQMQWLFLLALPVSAVSWTITHEEIFKEAKLFCVKCSNESKHLLARKFFYLFTCEYCFSHYVTLFFLVITKFHLLYNDWRGYLIAGFALVWIANVYMSLFGFIRVGMKKEKMDADIEEIKLKKEKNRNKINDKN